MLRLEVGKKYRDGFGIVHTIGKNVFGTYQETHPFRSDNGETFRVDGSYEWVMGRKSKHDLLEEVTDKLQLKHGGIYVNGYGDVFEVRTGSSGVDYPFRRFNKGCCLANMTFTREGVWTKDGGLENIVREATPEEVAEFLGETPLTPPIPKSGGCECGAHATSSPQLHSEWCPQHSPKFFPESKVAMSMDLSDPTRSSGAGAYHDISLNDADVAQMNDDGVDYFPNRGPDFRRKRVGLSEWEAAIARANGG